MRRSARSLAVALRFPSLPAASLAVLLLAAPSVSPAFSGDAGRPFRIAAGPAVRGKAPSGKATTISRFAVKGLTLEVEFLEPRERGDFIRALDPSAGDPFAVAPGTPEIYHAFRVSFQNAAAADVLFQAGNVLLLSDRKDRQFPIDLTDLYRVAAAREVADPEAVMRRLGRVIFDGSTTIPRGARLSRMLVFGPLPQKWKQLGLHFSYLQIGTETHTVSFTFHKELLEG